MNKKKTLNTLSRTLIGLLAGASATVATADILVMGGNPAGSLFYTQAQALAEELLKKQPSNKELWMLRSQIALRQSKPLQALSSLESAISLGEEQTANFIIAATYTES